MFCLPEYDNSTSKITVLQNLSKKVKGQSLLTQDTILYGLEGAEIRIDPSIHRNNAKFRRVFLRHEPYTVGWILNDGVSACMICDCGFDIVNRRHHCRACGKVICNSCSLHKVNIKQLRDDKGEYLPSRVCDICASQHRIDEIWDLSREIPKRGISTDIVDINFSSMQSISVLIPVIPQDVRESISQQPSDPSSVTQNSHTNAPRVSVAETAADSTSLSSSVEHQMNDDVVHQDITLVPAPAGGQAHVAVEDTPQSPWPIHTGTTTINDDSPNAPLENSSHCIETDIESKAEGRGDVGVLVPFTPERGIPDETASVNTGGSGSGGGAARRSSWFQGSVKSDNVDIGTDNNSSKPAARRGSWFGFAVPRGDAPPSSSKGGGHSSSDDDDDDDRASSASGQSLTSDRSSVNNSRSMSHSSYSMYKRGEDSMDHTSFSETSFDTESKTAPTAIRGSQSPKKPSSPLATHKEEGTKRVERRGSIGLWFKDIITREGSEE